MPAGACACLRVLNGVTVRVFNTMCELRPWLICVSRSMSICRKNYLA